MRAPRDASGGPPCNKSSAAFAYLASNAANPAVPALLRFGYRRRRDRWKRATATTPPAWRVHENLPPSSRWRVGKEA